MKRLNDSSDVPEAEKCVLLAASTKQPEEREFVVDSGASMQKVSKRETLILLRWRP